MFRKLWYYIWYGKDHHCHSPTVQKVKHFEYRGGWAPASEKIVTVGYCLCEECGEPFSFEVPGTWTAEELSNDTSTD